MKTRGIIGKRIAKIIQSPVMTSGGQKIFDVTRIILDDGTQLSINIRELDTSSFYGCGCDIIVRQACGTGVKRSI